MVVMVMMVVSEREGPLLLFLTVAGMPINKAKPLSVSVSDRRQNRASPLYLILQPVFGRDNHIQNS